MMVILSVGVLASCNKQLIQDDSYGYLDFSMDSDISTDLIVKSGDEMVFAIDVRNESGQTIESVEDHRTVTTDNPIILKVGTYDVVAMHGNNLNAAFNNPYYEGTTNVRIYPDILNTVDIKCTLANAKFSVDFPAELSDDFEVYEVTVTNGVGDALVLSNNPDSSNPLEAGIDAEAYFAVTGTLRWSLYLKNNDGGEYRSQEVVYSDVKAKQHYHLTFQLEEDVTSDGAFAVKVTLNNSLDDTSHNLILDFDNRYVPDFETNSEFAVTSGEPVSVPVGNSISKVLNITAEEGVKNLRIYHSNEALAAAGLPYTSEFVGTSTDLSDIGIKTSVLMAKSLTPGAQQIAIDITDFVSKLPVALYEIKFAVTDNKDHYNEFVLVLEIISDVDAEAVAVYTGWACFAKLEGRYFTADIPEGITFQYKEAGDSEWIELDQSLIEINTSTLRYTATVFGLTPSTEYVFRAVSAEDKETKEITFSTTYAETVHNLSFDDWYKDGSAWMPNLNSSNYVWDSANPGTAGLGTVPTTPEESDVVKGKAARLETCKAMGMLASGNIYIGKFGKVAGLGAELDWGYPFSSRPIALKGYYKYSPKTIDMTKDPYKGLAGQGDQCQIQVLLTDWPEMFTINTSKKQFVDFENDEHIIAHGSLVSGNNDNGYVRFTMPLVYRNNRTPKYIVIVAAASRYGDYFTGAVGSVLKVDEFQLVYDPADLTSQEYQQVFSKVSPF